MWDLPEKNGFIEDILEEDPRYSNEAYSFILDTLRDVIEGLREVRHVTGQELSEGCRRRALELYGPLARPWGKVT